MQFPGRSPSVVYGHAQPPTICARPGRAEYNDAWGSLSTRSTFWSSRAYAPARWKQVEVLPTPPFWLSIVITGMRRTSPLHGASRLRAPRGTCTVQAPHTLLSTLHGARLNLPCTEQGTASLTGAWGWRGTEQGRGLYAGGPGCRH